MKSMFEILMDLPLFRGISHEKMSTVVEKTKFHFLKYPIGETIVNEGDRCTHIKFIISGKVKLTVNSEDGRFTVDQCLKTPDVISPEFLFGRDTTYPGDVVAVEDTGILQISKQDYLKILNSDEIFLFNYLNLLSIYAQKSSSGVLALTRGSLEERIAFWIIALTQTNSCDIEICCRHRDMYSMFGVQRSVLISTLDSMKEKGLIDYEKNMIKVLDRKGVCNLVLPRRRFAESN